MKEPAYIDVVFTNLATASENLAYIRLKIVVAARITITEATRGVFGNAYAEKMRAGIPFSSKSMISKAMNRRS